MLMPQFYEWRKTFGRFSNIFIVFIDVLTDLAIPMDLAGYIFPRAAGSRNTNKGPVRSRRCQVAKKNLFT